MEEFPYDKYVTTGWTTAKAPKPKTTVLARKAIQGKPKDTDEAPSREHELKATLKDLIPEEKAKVGELVKKLATTKAEKDQLEKQLQETMQSYEARMQRMEHEYKKLNRTNRKLEGQVETYMQELTALSRDKSVEKERPVTPMRVVKEEGTQAEPYFPVQDKETQATDSKSTDLPASRPESEPKAKALHEVQSLHKELSALSTSLRQFNSSTHSSPLLSSLLKSRGSMSTPAPVEDSQPPKQAFKKLFTAESPEKEERFRAVLERAQASTQRAQKLIGDDGRAGSGSVRDSEDVRKVTLRVMDRGSEEETSSLRPSVLPRTQPMKSALKNTGLQHDYRPMVRPESDLLDPPLSEADLSVMDEVYNDSLFSLVDELEAQSVSKPRQSQTQLLSTIEELEKGTDLEYSLGSSPWAEREEQDSFEELQRRNKALKLEVGQTFSARKGVWRP